MTLAPRFPRAKMLVAWLLVTAWLCIEAAMQAANRVVKMPSEGQMAVAADHLQQAIWAVGPRFAAWMAAGLALWFVQGLLGLVITVWAGVEATRFIRNHARRQREALAANQGGAQ